MATVYLTSASPENDPDLPYARQNYERLVAYAACDPFREHTLTDDPATADLILFVEIRGAGLFFEEVRRHPLVRQYREKCFLVCEMDHVIPFLPGVYASIERRWASPRVRSGHYLRALGRDHVMPSPLPQRPDFLFSFVGATESSPLRKRLGTLDHPRGFFFDTSGEAAIIQGDDDKKACYHDRYADICERSLFILCPRGLGVSSMRLFETMEMGRVPVIISDDWVPPAGPDWDRFSVRVAERDIASIPARLEALEAQGPAMAKRARATWEAWFSERASFHRIVEWCLDIQAQRTTPERIARFGPYVQLLRPQHLRHFARQKVYTLLGR